MHSKSFSRLFCLLTIVSPLLMIAGCGDGSGPQRILATPVPPTTGIFVDAAVAGAGWQTSGGASGLTNDLGEFMYVPGETVTFSVGGIVLGSAPGAPVISAVELTGSNNPTDKAAVNQFIFLQSIDADQDPDNGITISSSTTTAAAGQTLDFADPDFPNAVAAVVAAIAPGNAVVSEIAALAHFYSTYAALGGSDTFRFSFPGFPPVRSGVTYELVFADEFNTGTVPNPEVWNYDLGYGDFGWGNNEWQEYTDSTDNVRVEDGNLVIQARCDTPPCGVRNGTVTSGRITTQDKFEFRYGTVIARIKPPVGDGAWPAFWSLGANFPEIGWPRSGEIDFMEMHNAFSNERTTHFTMHWCDESIQTDPSALCFPQSNGWMFFTQNREFAQSLGNDYHLFEADWDQNRIIGRIDGITYFERTIEPGTMEEFLREFFMILNVAMGGTLGSDNQPPNGNEVWPQTMLVDYVRVYQRTDAPTQELSIDFEDAPGSYNFNNFEGGVGDVVMNPAPEGINTSAQVGRMQKFAATSMATFGGSTLVTAFDVPPGSAFTMKVWSSRPVDVTFKLEGSPSAEAVASHGGGSAWEELTFNFGEFTSTATGITLIFDNGILGDAGNNPDAWTFFFDDISRVDVLAQIDLPITFDEPGVDYTLTDFGDPVTAMTTLIDDPDDAGNTVASTTKPSMAPVWAGTTISTPAGLASPIPFTANATTIGVRVYSPAAGIPVRLKADDMVGEGAISVEAEVMTTVANEWETLVFDFSNQVDGTPALDLGTQYRVLSIFFNFGTEGDDATYLWDDVEFGVPLPDTTAPTLLSVSIDSSNATGSLATTGDVVTVELTADESIAAPTVTIGGVAAEIEGGGPSWVASRALTAADADGVVSFSIEFADLAGNVATPVSVTTDESSVTLDATAPTLAILGAPTEPQTTLDPIVLTFQFSEPVTGFTLSDIQRMNGGASAFTVVDGATYTARFTPNGIGNLSVAVAAGAVTDTAGNANEVAASVTVPIELDADAPLLNVVSIMSSGNAGFARAGDIVTVEMTANEDIAAPTVTIAGGPADSVTGAGASWQASRTMLAADPEGDIGFVINFEDTGGNPGPQTTGTTDNSSVIFDVTAPTLLSISGVPDPVMTLESIMVTFEFDEEVTGFELGDIDVTSGSADTFDSVDAATYTASVTPDGSGDLTISVAADAATDLAGNGNEAAAVTATVDLSPFWQQVWSDDFTGTALNTGNWTKRTDADCPDPCTGVQSYRTERVSVGADLLTIEARDDVARGGPTYTSGLIDTRGKLEFQHGRIEVDVKLPMATTGIRPSLWMLPATGEYGPWPLSGEIDITNAPGGGSPTLDHTLRYGLPEPEDTTASGTSAAPGAAATQLFTYALEWEAGELRWFVDGVHVATQIQDNWYAYSEDADGVYTLGTGAAPFDQDFYLLLSLAVDSAGGAYPRRLQVDAVRVYECANPVDPDAGTGCAGLIDAVDPGIAPVVATSPPYNSAPYTEMLEVYTDAPAMLQFVDDEGATTPGTLVPATSGAVTSNIAADDMGNTVWNLDINATSGAGSVVMGPGTFDSGTGYFDLTGGETAGEVLFAMRVNSSAGNPQLAVKLDSDNGTTTGSGAVSLDVAELGVWRPYSVKIADIVTDSVMGTSLDLGAIVNLFTLEASGGTVNLDLDDISVKVACRDVGRCEATPRLRADAAEIEYSQDFEALGIDDLFALSADPENWVVFATVFASDGTTFLYQYGTFPAPNDPGAPAFSLIATGQGGPNQGDQQLNIFNDYNNGDHFNMSGNRIEASVFRQRNVMESDLGKTITFSFDAKLGDIGGATTANAFIKTLNPMTGFNLTNCLLVNTTSIPDIWQRYSISLPVAADDNPLVGQLIQFGFASTASNGDSSGIFYDNLVIEIGSGDVAGVDCVP